MKLRIDFGEGGFQGFLVRHVEKIVLGAAVFLLLGFVWFGWRLPSYEKQPNDLEAMVSQATDHMEIDSSKIIIEERQPPADDRVIGELTRRPVGEGSYGWNRPLDPPLLAQQAKRTDPILYPPIKLEAAGMTAALAYQPLRGLTDMTVVDPNAGPRQAAGSKKRTTRTSRSRPRASVGDESDEEDDFSVSQQTTVPARILPADYVIGYHPSGSGNAIPVGRSFIAVKALVPYEKQVSEYERVFANALGYSPLRDRPRYVHFYAQRADVTDNPAGEVPESDWKPGVWTRSALESVRGWVGTPNDFFDPMHGEQMLTMPAPPIMFRNLEDLLVHSESPLMARLAAPGTAEGEEGPLGLAGVNPLQVAPSEEAPSDPLAGLAGPGVRPGEFPRYADTSNDDEEEEGEEEEEDDEEEEEEDEENQDYAYSRRMGSDGPTQMIRYKLVRFFDFNVKPGRLYRYRIQLWIEDPNYLLDPSSDPPPQSLDASVLKRLEEVHKEEQQKGGSRIYWVKTDWSEPSDVVSIPDPDRVVVGSVTPASKSKIPQTNVEYVTREAQGTVEPIQWDPARGVDVTIDEPVRRGAVLDFRSNAEYVQPVTLVIKSLENYQFHTGFLIADLRGGELLPGGAKDNPLTSLGQFLVIGPDGRIIVRNELGDSEDFQRYSFITPEQAAAEEEEEEEPEEEEEEPEEEEEEEY